MTEIYLNASLTQSPSTSLETVLVCLVADLMQRLGLTETWVDLSQFDNDPSLVDYYLSGNVGEDGNSTGPVYLSKEKITELPAHD